MAVTVNQADYFYATVKDAPGEGRKLLEFLSAHGINLLAFTAFPVGEGKTQLDLFSEDNALLRKAAEEAGIPLVGPKKAFLLQGDDRTGVLGEYHLRLADAGVNVIAANGVCDGSGRFGFVLWVNPEDQGRAAEALGV
ncbi:MAG: ACT domain-containing protein [Planctomycetota bacterium]|jgi:hypothetical protein